MTNSPEDNKLTWDDYSSHAVKNLIAINDTLNLVGVPHEEKKKRLSRSAIKNANMLGSKFLDILKNNPDIDFSSEDIEAIRTQLGFE